MTTGAMPRRKENLAPAIDAYLQKRGSPMAGMGMAFLRAGRKYGVDPRMLVGMAVIESGAGAHLAQAYNPFNWGIHRGQQYGSWEESIMDVARGLRRNYLDQGLKTPGQIVSKYAPSSDGNDESNWAKVVGQVMNQLGGNVSAGAVPTPPGAAPPAPLPLPPQAPTPVGPTLQWDPLKMSRQIRDQFVTGKGRIDLMGMPGIVESSFTEVQPLPPPAPLQPATGRGPIPNGQNGVPQQPVLTGKGIALPINYKSTHATSGLEKEGFTRAIDIMGAPGTPVRSPMGGTVLYFHPTGAQGGGSMEVRFADGSVGWIGHIANGLPAGTKITPGMQLAVISADHPRPHVHWSLR